MIWLKENWFKIVIIVLLLMCYHKLGQIDDSVFYVADIVDSTGQSIKYSIIDTQDSIGDVESSVNNLEGYLDEINNKTHY